MTGPAGPPGPLTILSLGLLVVVGMLLLWPLLSGGPAPHPGLIAGVLLLRLGVQLLRARHDERLRRPVSWAVDLILIGLLFSVSGQR
ncbi:hypothetical protein [Deinococcus navajonensis]|uniref:DUF3017 domain-containing protein n=1 Tax=Deinococcus navajonensis TaxID=309884 RepID=A0ABV8XUR2_9DEIO